jgi:hypothetical protein
VPESTSVQLITVYRVRLPTEICEGSLWMRARKRGTSEITLALALATFWKSNSWYRIDLAAPSRVYVSYCDAMAITCKLKNRVSEPAPSDTIWVAVPGLPRSTVSIKWSMLRVRTYVPICQLARLHNLVTPMLG